MPRLVSCITNCLCNTAIKYHIDYPIKFSIIRDRTINIKGWIVSKEAPIRKIYVLYNGSIVGEVTPNISRKRVSEIFSEYYHASKPGFDIDIFDISDGTLLLKAYLDNESTVDIAKFNIEKKSFWPNKILYIHIPKTGGSSVNRFISSHFSPDEAITHVESSPGWRNSISNKKILFISGHIPYPVFKDLLGSLDGYLKVVTLRNPIQHVISHLAWVRHLSDPEGRARFRFDSHPKHIQEMSLKLAKINLGDPIHISKFISEMNNYEYNLMDNTQTRYLSKITPGAYISYSNIDSAKKNLKEFDVIGVTEKMDDFFKFLSTKAGWEPPALSSIPKINILSNKYRMDSNDEKLVTALMPLIRYDMELYDSLGKII